MSDDDGYMGSQRPAGAYSSPGGSGYAPSQSPPSPYAAQLTAKQWLAKALAEFLTDNRADKSQLTDADAKQLNVQVTASYAKMYLSNPAVFKWAGMAAFASHEVGGGMQQAWQLGFGTGTEMFNPAATWIGGLITGRGGDVGPMMGKKLFWALSGGNRIVWSDIFWQHVAYRDGGIASLQGVRKAGDLSQQAIDAWLLIDAGAKAKNVAKIWQGNAALLEYEQREVLQKQIYDLDEMKDIWKAISPDVPTPIPDHDVAFTTMVPGGNIGKFGDRWKWISESMLPAWKRLETNDPERTKQLIKAL